MAKIKFWEQDDREHEVGGGPGQNNNGILIVLGRQRVPDQGDGVGRVGKLLDMVFIQHRAVGISLRQRYLKHRRVFRQLAVDRKTDRKNPATLVTCGTSVESNDGIAECAAFKLDTEANRATRASRLLTKP